MRSARMKRTTRSILFVAQDAGGFQAIIPVFRRLQKRTTMRVAGVFGDVARVLPTSRGLQLVHPEKVSDAKLRRVFDDFQPQIVVVGPSASATSLDKRAMQVARQRSIPIVMVTDNCMNANLFFGKAGDAPLMPDRVCVMNAVCAKEVQKHHVPVSRLMVTGSPYFDTVKHSMEGAQQKKDTLLFICQPFTEFAAAFPGAGYGYSEVDVFSDVVTAAQRLGTWKKIVVRWHPRTRNRRKFDEIIRQSALPIALDAASPLQRLIRTSSLVVGMNSTALMDAVLMGKPVVSYQPQLNREDALMTNAWGLSTLVTDPKKLPEAMRRAVRKNTSKHLSGLREKMLPSGATNRVIRVIEELLTI